ncbi:histone acetyltransferases subunit 3-domain-containing protein [Pisolithus orientalis]|uniref:histone acetyltransferases subunit 3-domain-containing protein n=1 Tax=Pisolithus orientalis TaxID=936130 RepID=UPI0022245616|nr:histone acetyltransferases subunit 3-domain-containing protein [Pisolithus orientalis]KAI6009576.1 histone acetyltransferases subunit 3-domain-containing protein [Pisolithus orientalis]
MSSKLFPYSQPTPIRSALFKNPQDPVPPTDDLDALQNELKSLRQRCMERAKKAGEDLKTLEESMRRMKEKVKGKAKAMEKVNRERGFTPHRESRAPSIVSSLPPSGRASVDPRRSLQEDLKKKKKKRKREDDSDLEDSLQSTIGPDFSVPPSVQLLPPRPPVAPPPVAGPSKPTEVMEDFSKLKQPPQVPVNTFYTSIEPWIRGIKEEDIGFLEFTGDEIEPYIIPKLGRHYTEGDSSGSLPKWDPSTLSEPDLLTEERSHGPLTERLISALLPMPDVTVWKGVKAAEEAMEGRPGGTGAAAARREKVNVADLEERIQDTMRFHGLLPEPPNYSARVDDPIATALRHAQQELREVVAMNKARRERLVAIAKDRLAYQEFLDARDSLDKVILATYTKLQKKDAPKLGKKKKRGPESNGSTSTVDIPKPPPSALGLGPDDDLSFKTRAQWVSSVGSIFEEKERECPGRIWNLPKKSIYEGLEEVVRQ